MLRMLLKQGVVLSRHYVTNVLLGTLQKKPPTNNKKRAKSFVIEFLRSTKKAIVFLAGVAFECCHSGKCKKKKFSASPQEPKIESQCSTCMGEKPSVS